MAVGIDRAPDWSIWRHIPTAKLHEAVALSLNIEPKKLRRNPRGRLTGKPSFDEGQEFNDRVFLAERCLGNTLPGPVNFPAMRYFDEDPVVRLTEFARWAVSVGWTVPSELETLGVVTRSPDREVADSDPNEQRPKQARVQNRPASRPPSRTKSFWPAAREIAFEWLIENGCPEPGDGYQSELERHVAKWIEDHRYEASESAIRRHVTSWIQERRAELNP